MEAGASGSQRAELGVCVWTLKAGQLVSSPSLVVPSCVGVGSFSVLIREEEITVYLYSYR